MKHIDLATMPAFTHRVFLALRDTFDINVCGQEIPLEFVCRELARHAYSRDVSPAALSAWAAKCAPDIDALITTCGMGPMLPSSVLNG